MICASRPFLPRETKTSPPTGSPRRRAFSTGVTFAMVRISISVAAFEALSATLPLGFVEREFETDELTIWIEPAVADRLGRHARARRFELRCHPSAGRTGERAAAESA